MQLDQTDPVVQQVKKNLSEIFGDRFDQQHFVVAVSGGGDSMAMLYAVAALVPMGRLQVVSVNHHFRAEAADELALVERACHSLGVAWQAGHWEWDGKGNLQAAAREGRWAILKAIAQANRSSAVLIGHTEDDQIENFFLRLARGSGVDGLAGIQLSSHRDGIQIVRPLLSIGRQELRAWLTRNGIEWADDPTNEDSAYGRVRARQMMAQLKDLGLTRKRVLQTVEHMRSASEALDTATRQFVHDRCRTECGDVIIGLSEEDFDNREIFLRAATKAIQWVGGQVYKPRYESLVSAIDLVLSGKRNTLSGCVLSRENNRLRVGRELSAVENTLKCTGDGPFIWDHRWIVETSKPIDHGEIRALGEDGLAHCLNWRQIGAPRHTLLTTPSVWANDTLIAAPIAGYENGWTAQIAADFADWLVTH